MENKLIRKGWYDGWFYARFIDSDFTRFRDRIFKYIEPDKKIIDVGCGTGGFSLKMAGISNYVLGIDISSKQIEIAQERLAKSEISNAEFIHTGASDLKDHISDKRFDYAIMIFLLHEIPQTDRLKILKSIKPFVDKIVILDYHHPMGHNISGYIIRATEFFAGKDHFNNFRDYNRRGGLTKLLEEADLKIVKEKINRPQVFHTAVVEPAAGDMGNIR